MRKAVVECTGTKSVNCEFVVNPVSDKTLTPASDYAETKVIVAESKPSAATLFLLALAAVAIYFCYLIARPFLNL